jgi:exosortase
MNLTPSSNSVRSIMLPYLILGVLHLPLLLMYLFRDLWSDLRAHYHFFPFLLASIAFLVWDRWPRESTHPLRVSSASPVLFVFSALILSLAVLFLEPPLACLSFALGLSSFLLRVKDVSNGGSLFPISMLMYVLVYTPFGVLNEDRRIITLLQQWSAGITSVLLDLVGVTHDMPGTILRTSERSWGVEEACSGVQSFYTLLFCSVFLTIWSRRSALRAAVLVGSSMFWALVMNTMRIFLIPVAHFGLSMDLSTGWQHAALGYCTLILGIFMLFSTDQFLDFLFGSIDSEKSGTETEASSVGRFWNRFVAGQSNYVSDDWQPAKNWSYLHFVVVGIPLLLTVVLSPGLISLMGSQGVDFFRSDVVMRVSNDWFPAEIDGWKLESYEASTRERGSDLGQRSDVWHYRGHDMVATFSFDQAFPGWHELTTCYQNSETGWQVLDRGRGRSRLAAKLPTADSSAEGAEVSLVQVELIEPTSGRGGYLLFGLDDAEGVSINAPGDWSLITNIIERLKNRFAYEVRASFFRSEGYQTQVFIPRDVSAAERAELKNLYLKLRALAQVKMREAKQAKQFWNTDELVSMHNAEKAKEVPKETLAP